MERGSADHKSWDSFYDRTMHLPSPNLTEAFLAHLPQDAHILDFGAGSGAWTAAFLRDRPDLTVDVLDRNIDRASALPADFKGQRIVSSFETYRAPEMPYHAIWARSVLFFLEPTSLAQCFHELAQSLAGKGIIAFTMVDDCPAAKLAKFHGMSELSIREMLEKEGLELVEITPSEPLYGSKNIPVQTFEVFARRNDCGI